ncbi:MAG: hypothetical protein ACRYG7_25275 [Janthinobacterium lividum]
MSDATIVNTPTRAPEGLWKPAFLCVFAECGNATAAAQAAGIDASTAYRARQVDAEFKQQWETAKLVAADTLRQEAWRRAVEGGRQYKFHVKTGAPLLFPKGHPQAGQPYYEMVYSDALLLTLLKAYAPDEFKDRSTVDVNTLAPPPPAYDLDKLSLAEKLQLLALSRKALTSDSVPDATE